MKLLVNTASTFKGGGVQVAISFIQECRRINENKYIVVLGERISKEIDESDFPMNFTFIKAPFRPATRYFSLESHNSFLKDAEKKFKPDVVFTTSGPSYWRPNAPHLMGYNIPHYIYPKSPYFDKITVKNILWWRGMKLFAFYNFKYNADAYVVQTDDVKERLKKFIKKEAVYTVYNTINSHYVEQKEYPNKIDGSKNYFRLLTLSAWYPHKNLEIIPKIVEELRFMKVKDVKFIVTIDHESFDLSELKGISEIVNIGPVKIEEAASLYKECNAMFLPTLLECFSASYVEAMQMRKPILTSDMGFAHTICEDAALYFDPMDSKDIAKKIVQLKDSSELQNNLINKGFHRLKIFGSAFERAKKYLDICTQLVK